MLNKRFHNPTHHRLTRVASSFRRLAVQPGQKRLDSRPLGMALGIDGKVCLHANGLVHAERRLELALGRDAHALFLRLDVHADIAQRVECRSHFLEIGPVEQNVAPGDRRGAGIAARLDPVRHDHIGRAMQALDAFDVMLFSLTLSAVIAELGYVPYVQARALALRRKTTAIYSTPTAAGCVAAIKTAVSKARLTR